ncbi:chitin-binding domain protein cbd-1-like [Lycorma delicatula]|uniref:chitin-binding domain protein cbd-1-like n=1 Tax=Lycorma delicatula TaxID=130591 RepID=UPI003F5100DD
MDCSCTLLLSIRRLMTYKLIAVISFLIIGHVPYTYSGPVTKMSNSTRIYTNYSNLDPEKMATAILMNSVSLCKNKADGMYSHPLSVGSYYMCKKGEYRLHHCNEGHIFNELSLNCEQKLSNFPGINPCDTQPDGLVPDYTTNCNQYFQCRQGMLIDKKSCGTGLRFSPASQSCKPADQVSCTHTHCRGSADGFFITPGSMCNAYYTCINEIKKNYVCPSGLVFNRNSQTCTGSGGVCYELLCTGRTNGLYADTTHGCQRYYVCEGGELKSVGGCPRGLLFNGIICVNSSYVTCSSAENTAIGLSLPTTDICTGLQDGAHSVSDEYCQEYILCKSGMTIAELQCPAGQNFDGHKCTNDELVPCSSFCAGKSNGFHANIRKHCQEYVNCTDGYIASIKKCSHGTIYNGEMCVSSSTYQCPTTTFEEDKNNKKICLNLNNGFHTDYISGCKEYFYCYNGELLIHNSCLEGTVWNGKECVQSHNYVCDGPQISPECSVRQNGFYADISKSSNCNKYFYCYDRMKVQLRCPVNYVFNGNECVPSESYNCPITETDCHIKGDGYYTNINSGCQSYYYCSNGNKITYVCPSGHVFNGNDCVPSTTYECPGNLSDDCYHLNNGYYPDTETHCQKYFYCLNYKKIMTLSCPPQEIFDGLKCVSAQKNSCQNYTKISCNYLQDNVYVNPGSNCNEYFQCSNQKMTSFNTCAEGYSFNGNACIKTTNNSCETVMKKQAENLTKCNKKNNGFFSDLISGCKSYFYCIGGTKTALSCPSGKLFNGEICISDKNFHCPTTKITDLNI